MKSNRQRRKEIAEKRMEDRSRRDAELERRRAERRAILPEGAVAVNASLLARANSYTIPDFVARGYYLDRPFTCKECGREEVWTATQQKWWYEVAKGDRLAVAVRCRPCRRREQARAAAARKVHEEGIAARGRS
ncbi:MAG TPA: zinc-ribbon domain containing protein [Candidatus Kapabacteria bacterium]|nr:zinc-ribbon domain containing protein [Candidatus Kapabacteria bacterium]